MNRADEIFESISKKPFSLKSFIRDHKVGILGTIAFHLIVLIILLLVKIQSYKKVHELELVLEYIEEVEQQETEEQETETREEFLARMLERQLRQSNQAVNISKLEEELSTEKYVEEVKNELEEQRSEEWLKRQEEIQEVLNREDLVPVKPEPEVEENDKEFTGPTNIKYEFSEAPYARKSFDLPVPVYKCRGFGEVEVEITVNNSGDVTGARANVLNATEDPECLSEVAERFALKSTFRADFTAPSNHRGKIIYRFVAQ